MQTLSATKNVLIAGVFLSLLFFNVVSLRCETKLHNLSNVHPQTTKESNYVAKYTDNDWQGDNRERFKELEWLIMQNLLKQYGKLDADAELAELPD